MLKFLILTIRGYFSLLFSTIVIHNVIRIDTCSRFRRIRRILKWTRLKIPNRSGDVFARQNALMFYQIPEYPTSTIRGEANDGTSLVTMLKYTYRFYFYEL